MSPAPDKIGVAGIDCVAAIGVSSEERALRQRLSIDVEVSTDIRPAAASDAIADALDYSRIVALVVELAEGREFHLIEALAEAIAGRILTELGGAGVRVVIRKLNPPVAGRVDFARVEIVRAAGEAGR